MFARALHDKALLGLQHLNGFTHGKRILGAHAAAADKPFLQSFTRPEGIPLKRLKKKDADQKALTDAVGFIGYKGRQGR